MKEKTFDSIARALEDAISFARGDKTRGRIVAGPGLPSHRQKPKRSAPRPD